MKKMVLGLALILVSVAFGSYAWGADCEATAGKCNKIDLLKGATVDDFNFYLEDGAKKEDIFSITSEGVLTVKGKPFGWLETKKKFRNFVFSTEFRYPNKDDQINSGLFLRINGESPNFLPRCIEMQLAPHSIGDLYGFWDMKIEGETSRFSQKEGEIFGVLRGVKFAKEPKKDDLTQWQKVVVTCIEGDLTVKINGEEVNSATGVENIDGTIGFQSEGSPIEFRNAFVVEL